MNKTRYPFLQLFLQIVLFSVLFIGYSSGLFVYPIRNATPMLLLPLMITFAMFEEELPSAMVGLFVGIFTDSLSSFGGIFHTVFFMILGMAVSLFIHYFLNNNIRSAFVLVLIGSLLYFLLRWLFCHAFGDTMIGSTVYLMQYAIPSTLYTTVFVFPLYYLQRLLHRFKL